MVLYCHSDVSIMSHVLGIFERNKFQRNRIAQGLGMQRTEADAQEKQDEWQGFHNYSASGREINKYLFFIYAGNQNQEWSGQSNQ